MHPKGLNGESGIILPGFPLFKIAFDKIILHSGFYLRGENWVNATSRAERTESVVASGMLREYTSEDGKGAKKARWAKVKAAKKNP